MRSCLYLAGTLAGSFAGLAGLIAGLFAPAAPALAQGREPSLPQGRIEASRESCSTLQNLVQQRGRVLIYTGRYLYDYYVADCGLGRRNVPAYLASRDNPQCFVGYDCVSGH